MPARRLSCVDDSPECVGRRQTALRQLVAAEDRAWVRQPATPAAYASGVRLFAFKAKKRNSPARSWPMDAAERAVPRAR